MMLTIADTHSTPEPRPIAERFMALFAEAAADGVTLDDERELHAAFLSASLAGEHERCRQMVEDAGSRLGAVRAARLMEQQRDAVRREIASARATFERHLSAITRTNGDVESRLAEFSAAEAAGDVAKCRELAAMAENVARAKLRPPAVIEAERREMQEGARKAVERADAERKREARLQALRERCAQGWNIVEEIERRGTLRLGDDGAVLYSGAPLDDDVLQAAEWKAHDIRNALRQRWTDRVLIPAPAAEAA